MLKIYYGNIRLLQDPLVFEDWFEKMGKERKEKIRKCQNLEDKKRSLLAGILLFYGLNQTDATEGVFSSITHSGDYAMCVISDRRVGVDLENRYRKLFFEQSDGQLDAIARKSLTSKELEDFLSLKKEEKADAMLSYWTRKESYSKAMGKGLVMDFATIDTKELDAFFWSNWIEEGYFCSLYVEDAKFDDKQLQELLAL